jgi:broad specificity phosphatase PhoE
MSTSGEAVSTSPEGAVDGPTPVGLGRLFLVRHAQSTWNEEHRIQGQQDPPLSGLGRHQAAVLGKRFAGCRPRALYVSDLRRTRQTAQTIASATGLEAQLVPGLREIRLGEWEGRTGAELAIASPELWRLWTERADWDLIPGGEGGAAFARRVRETLTELWARHPVGDVVCVTHGGVVQTALLGVLGRLPEGTFPFKVENASISVLERRPATVTLLGAVHGPTIAGVNDVAHLATLVRDDVPHRA